MNKRKVYVPITVSSGMPVPADPGARIHYPFKDIQVNESFLIEFTLASKKRVQAATSIYNKRHPNTRFITEQEKGGTRVWRLK